MPIEFPRLGFQIWAPGDAPGQAAHRQAQADLLRQALADRARDRAQADADRQQLEQHLLTMGNPFQVTTRTPAVPGIPGDDVRIPFSPDRAERGGEPTPRTIDTTTDPRLRAAGRVPTYPIAPPGTPSGEVAATAGNWVVPPEPEQVTTRRASPSEVWSQALGSNPRMLLNPAFTTALDKAVGAFETEAKLDAARTAQRTAQVAKDADGRAFWRMPGETAWRPLQSAEDVLAFSEAQKFGEARGAAEGKATVPEYVVGTPHQLPGAVTRGVLTPQPGARPPQRTTVGLDQRLVDPETGQEIVAASPKATQPNETLLYQQAARYRLAQQGITAPSEEQVADTAMAIKRENAKAGATSINLGAAAQRDIAQGRAILDLAGDIGRLLDENEGLIGGPLGVRGRWNAWMANLDQAPRSFVQLKVKVDQVRAVLINALAGAAIGPEEAVNYLKPVPDLLNDTSLQLREKLAATVKNIQNLERHAVAVAQAKTLGLPPPAPPPPVTTAAGSPAADAGRPPTPEEAAAELRRRGRR